MARWIILLFLFIYTGSAFTQTTVTDTLYSKHVQDKFLITVRKPANFSPNKKYVHVYMTDGTIGMGDYVLGKDKSWAATIPSNCIIIAIGHIGNWHDKRPRDLIPSDISKNGEKNFGKADLFYLFLKNELIPRTEKAMPNRKEKVFIGHSFGGLFCLYTLFRDDKLFNRHFAISPSCWANYYKLKKIEEKFAKTNTSLNANVTIYVGGLEFLNKVLSSTRGFYTSVTERKYKGLKIEKTRSGMRTTPVSANLQWTGYLRS